jgi:hypothetical protein
MGKADFSPPRHFIKPKRTPQARFLASVAKNRVCVFLPKSMFLISFNKNTKEKTKVIHEKNR